MASTQFFKKILHDKVLLLIAINVAVLLVASTIQFVLKVSRIDGWVVFENLALPSGLQFVLKPWTVVTYMFTDPDVIACMFNMLWLYWFGRMYELLTSPRRFVWLYIFGGVGGGAAYVIATSAGWIAGGAPLLGASAAVLAVVTATALTAPNMRLNMLFLGQIALKWVALVTIVLFVSGIMGGTAGGQVAHGGGVLAGIVMWLVWRMCRPRYDRMKIRPANQCDARERLDYLLDKVRRSGYSSLTQAERHELLDLGNKI